MIYGHPSSDYSEEDLMADWSMEELQDWDTRICEFGEQLGLDWYPIEYDRDWETFYPQ